MVLLDLKTQIFMYVIKLLFIKLCVFPHSRKYRSLTTITEPYLFSSLPI